MILKYVNWNIYRTFDLNIANARQIYTIMFNGNTVGNKRYYRTA